MRFILPLLLLATHLAAQAPLASNLPLVLLDAGGQPIVYGNPLVANLQVVDNGPGQLNRPTDAPAYTGPISIRVRGNYSAWLPQRPYGFETLDPATSLDTSVTLLGMPAEEDWILLALWNDKSFVRNTMLFELARRMGHYAPRTRHVEVLLNGEYAGVYVFCEKIKRDNNRLKIKKLEPEDTELPDISGGYIFKHDYLTHWYTNNWVPENCTGRRLNFEIVYPRWDDLNDAQFDYLRNYVDSTEVALLGPDFRDSLTGYRRFIDVPSWTDYLLLSEMSGNVDAYKKSVFFHKNRGEKLKMGPIWDFDWAMKFFPWASADASGWYYLNEPCNEDVLNVPYFKRLMEDTTFCQTVTNRWNALRSTVLDTTSLFGYMDSVVAVVDAAQARHFERWDCLGYDSGAPEVPPYPNSYAGEVEKLKKWFRLRLAWMDSQWTPDKCVPRVDIPLPQPQWSVFPNPTTDALQLKPGDRSWHHAILRNLLGQPVRAFSYAPTMPLDDLPAGLYTLEVYTGKKDRPTVLRVVKN